MTADANNAGNDVSKDELAWQRRLLPFMVRSVAVMAGFFLIVSVLLLFSLYREVRLQVDEPLPTPAMPATAAAAEQQRFQTLVALEQKVIDHRYRQVNVTLILRAWTRYLGFLTGMILAMVGAIFVLGKLREAGTTLNIEGSGYKGAISSSSPGLILATLGTVLMAITLVIPFQFDVRDAPVYLAPTTGAVMSSAPVPLTSATDRAAENCALFPGPECVTSTAAPAAASP